MVIYFFFALFVYIFSHPKYFETIIQMFSFTIYQSHIESVSLFTIFFLLTLKKIKMSNSNMLDTARCDSNIDFLRQTGDPDTYKTRPSPVSHPVGIPKTVDMSSTWATDDTLLANEKVPNNSGVIVFFPKNGAGSIYHYGIIPKNTESHFSDVTAIAGAGFPTPGTIPSADDYSANLQDVIPAWQAGVRSFQYPSALGVPRLETGLSLISDPDLSKEFSIVRQYGAQITLYSQTINGSTLTFNGTCSSGVISDTRDIAQDKSGSQCFGVTALQQTARNPKESISHISVMNGIVQIQGPDIPSAYAPPNEYSVDMINGGWTDFDALSLGLSQTTGPAASFANPANINGINDVPASKGMYRNLWNTWISPWNVETTGLNEAGAVPFSPGLGAYATVPSLQVDPIDEMGYLDVKFTFPVCIVDSAISGVIPILSAASFKFLSVVDHWFAYVKDTKTGTLGYNVIHRTKVISSTFDQLLSSGLAPSMPWAEDAGTASANNTAGVVDLGFETEIADEIGARGGMGQLGKYIGAKISLFVCPDLPTSQFVQMAVNLNQAKVSARARQIYKEGKTGPCHIIRYDNVGAGQQVHLKVIMNNECVAKGDLAPYVQQQTINPDMACDANVYPLVYALYNGKSYFKCTWSRAEYENFQRALSMLSQDDLVKMSGDSKSIATSAGSAGMFAGLGKALGQIGGGLLGHAGVGAEVGSGIGSLVDTFTGSDGQFGTRSDSAGQFGARTAAYGAGQWGANYR